MRVYDTPADGLADAMRLSAAMTWKMAAVGVPRGGGKAVLAVPELPQGEARRRLLLRYGELVASLGGTFRTAGDMNIGPRRPRRRRRARVPLGLRDDERPRRRQRARHGARRPARDPRQRRARLRVARPPGRTVLVQGCGAVGGDLARELADEGAARARQRRRRGARSRDRLRDRAADDAIATECDVYAPCAVGGTLGAETIPQLRCRVVAGSANNQLVEPEDAQRLHERGILWAPDYVINAGGVIQLIGLEDEGWDDDRLERALRRGRRHPPRPVRRGRPRAASPRARRPTVSSRHGSLADARLTLLADTHRNGMMYGSACRSPSIPGRASPAPASSRSSGRARRGWPRPPLHVPRPGSSARITRCGASPAGTTSTRPW